MKKLITAAMLFLLTVASHAQTVSIPVVPVDIKQIVLGYAHTRIIDLMYREPPQRYGESTKPEPRYLYCEGTELANLLQRVSDAYHIQDALQARIHSSTAISVLSNCMANGYFGEYGKISGEVIAAKRIRDISLPTFSLFLANNLFFEQEVSKVLGMPVSRAQVQHAKRLATWAGENGADAVAALNRINAFKP